MNTINICKTLLQNKNLEPFIRHIRFPNFKNIQPGEKLTFDFPITALVGQNGSNKSSVLRAIYGCPEGSNVGNFWFSTPTDPIEEQTNGKPRFIYSYYQADADKDVEVIKTRVQGRFSDGSINPDYWEPSRPLARDGMEKMPNLKDGEELKGRTKTRWNLVNKNVIFIDFRSELSAFDRYFYHYTDKISSFKSKQEFIRSRSKYLKSASDSDAKSMKIFKGQKEHIFRNEILSKEKISEISKILGKKYKQIKLIKHSFFYVAGESAIIKMDDFTYSEAFAGSGEFAVIKLVDQIIGAPKNSLIILDEPEVSLHPGAQTKLLDFIYKQVISEKHQVVIGTHSPSIIDQLPPEAIKTLKFNNLTGKITFQNSTFKDVAFKNIGLSSTNKKLIVEDRLAKELVEKVLKIRGQDFYESLEVDFMPGGASEIKSKLIPTLALSSQSNLFIALDGDQKPNSYEDLIIKDASESSYHDLEAILKEIISTSSISKDGSQRNPSETEVERHKNNMRKVFNYWKEKVYYLPKENPEEFLFELIEENETNLKLNITESNIKNKFKVLSNHFYSKSDFEDSSSEEIFMMQKSYIGKLINHETASDIIRITDSIMKK